jgi:hypothetical protein
MHPSRLKDGRNPAQKWLKEIACFELAMKVEKKIPSLQGKYHSLTAVWWAGAANRGFPPEIGALQSSDDGTGIAPNTGNPARKLRPPKVRPADFVRNSGQIYRSRTKRHFGVANCECFDTVRAQAPNKLVFGSLCRRLCSHFFAFRAPGGGAPAWNRIHRNGD